MYKNSFEPEYFKWIFKKKTQYYYTNTTILRASCQHPVKSFYNMYLQNQEKINIK